MAGIRCFYSASAGALTSEHQAAAGPCNPQAKLSLGPHPAFAAGSVVLGAAALATHSSKRWSAGALRMAAFPKHTARVVQHAGGVETQASTSIAAGEVEQSNLTPAAFDPLGDSASNSVQQIPPVELALGRVAMLAAVGYPAAELYHDDIAKALNMPNRLAANGTAPTLLNNGVFSPVAEVACVLGIWGIVTAAVQSTYASKDDDTKLDAVNPQPLRLPYLSPMLKSILNEVQRTNGRVAMLAIVIMIAQETITGQPAVGSLAAQ